MLALMRHGVTQWNLEQRLQGREDIPLSMAGEKQAKAAAAYLSRWHWNGIFTSPLIRAKRTAEIIAAELKLGEPEVMPGLIERDYGVASGMEAARRREVYPDGNYPGLEPLNELQARAVAQIDTFCKIAQAQNYIVVGHGGFINSVLAQYSNFEIGSGKTRLEPCSVSFLHSDGKAFKVGDYNT